MIELPTDERSLFEAESLAVESRLDVAFFDVIKRLQSSAHHSLKGPLTIAANRVEIAHYFQFLPSVNQFESIGS